MRRRGSRPLQIGLGLAAVLIALAVLYLVRDALGAFVLGALLAFLINPAVDWLEDRRIPRAAAIVVVFAGLLVAVAALGSMFIPLLTTEIGQLQQQAPALVSQAQERIVRLQGQPIEIFGFKVDLAAPVSTFDKQAGSVLLGQFGNALSIGLAAVNAVLQTLLMLIVAFLVSLDAHNIREFTRRLVPSDYREDFDIIWPKVKAMLRGYLRGQLILGTIIGVGVAVALWIEGVPFAFALGVLAGVTSLVPFIGPWIGAIPIELVALSVTPLKAILVGATYLLITNVVLQFLYPKIIGSAVRLPALLVIVAFIAGFSFAGILGMFIAIPVAATIAILFEHIYPRVYGSAA
jgi:predicted PurR-regulated permease PerM